jgi:hypothetical protein
MEAEMLRVTLETTNAAFVDTGNREIAKILRGLAMNFENGAREACQGRLRDSNGNVCGRYLFEPEPAEKAD